MHINNPMDPNAEPWFPKESKGKTVFADQSSILHVNQSLENPAQHISS
jgi:hypothetical protein